MTFRNFVMFSSWKRGFLGLGLVCLVFSGLQCTDKSTDPPATSGISILKPIDGSKFKMTDSVKIIWETDYTRRNDEFSVSVSDNSGKSWYLIKSLKTGKTEKLKVVYDTLVWVPETTAPNLGPIQLRVSAYQPEFFDISGFMTLEAGVPSKP